jgi:hypothetical protein
MSSHKRKSRSLSRLAKKKNVNSKKQRSAKEYLAGVLFLLILSGTIGFKIYKADRTGVIFDESRTFRSYAGSVNGAMSSYSQPNNHVLNSICIYYAHKYFGNYEHFIRIPSLTAGVCFSLALAYIIYRTIRTQAIRSASLAMISLVPFVFDYSFLARGYAFALAAIFIEIALVVALLEHRIKFCYWWVPVLVISLMNFIAFGAMLSSILFLAAFNFIFIVLYSPKLFREPTRRRLSVLVNLIAIPLIFIVSNYLLYRKIYTKIARSIAEKSTKGDPYLTYLHKLLIGRVFPHSDALGWVIFYGFIILIAVALAYRFYRLRPLPIGVAVWKKFDSGSAQSFIFLVTIAFLLIMFIFNVILDRPLGYLRNQVFLIPLVLLCVMLILDRFVYDLEKKSVRTVMLVIITVFIAAQTLRNLPESDSVGSHSMSVHLLRKLKAIDPHKTWNIAFSRKLHNYSLGVLYYQQFDKYKFRWTSPDQCDIYICGIKELPPGAACLERDFFRRFNCAAAVARRTNPDLKKNLKFP